MPRPRSVGVDRGDKKISVAMAAARNNLHRGCRFFMDAWRWRRAAGQGGLARELRHPVISGGIDIGSSDMAGSSAQRGQEGRWLHWTFGCGHVRLRVGHVDVLDILAMAPGWCVETAITDLEGNRAREVVPTLHAALCWSLRWTRARWPYLLALRTPAIYLDKDWEAPKRQLNEDPGLAGYRRRPLAVDQNRALQACARFAGDVLLVEAEHDEIIPRQVIDNYAGAFGSARSMTRRLIRGASHAFDDKAAQKDYTDVLNSWMTEMIVGSRGAIAERKVRDYKQEGRIDAVR